MSLWFLSTRNQVQREQRIHVTVNSAEEESPRLASHFQLNWLRCALGIIRAPPHTARVILNSCEFAVFDLDVVQNGGCVPPMYPKRQPTIAISIM